MALSEDAKVALEMAAKAAERVAERWRSQAEEWNRPPRSLDAEFVYRAAKHKADAADECAEAIRKLA